MQKTLTVGRTYAVTTSGTCDVTDANGTLITTASSGQQAVFVAPTSTVNFSDDSASVVAVFKLALAKTRLLGLLGGGKKEPDFDHMPALFLESAGAQYIDTGYIPNNETGLLVDQEKILTGDNMPMGCRNDNSSETRFYVSRSIASVEPTLPTGYGWGRWGRFDATYIGRQIGKLNWQNNRVAEINTASLSLVTLPFEPMQSVYIFAVNLAGQARYNWGGRIYVAQISQGAEIVHNYTPALSRAGKPCMYDKVSKASFVNANTTVGAADFVVGMTVEQARALGKLPADIPDEDKTLTVSLPASIVDGETVTDAEVQAALDAAADNGWDITIQTYTES